MIVNSWIRHQEKLGRKLFQQTSVTERWMRCVGNNKLWPGKDLEGSCGGVLRSHNTSCLKDIHVPVRITISKRREWNWVRSNAIQARYFSPISIVSVAASFQKVSPPKFCKRSVSPSWPVPRINLLIYVIALLFQL
jgi:hypothetical protein